MKNLRITLTSVYDLRKTFDLDKKILICFGVYPNNGLMNEYLYNLSRILNFVLLIISQISFTVLIVVSSNNLVAASDALVLSISVTSCINKIVHLVKNANYTGRMEKMLSQRIFHNLSSENEKIVQYYVEYSFQFGLCLRFGCFMACVTNGILPLFDEHFSGAMALGWQPWDKSEAVKFYLNAMLQIIALCTGACLSSTFDIFAAKLISIAIAQIEVLKNNLASINYESKDANKQFNENVQLHYEILRLVSITYRIFSMGMLGQMLSSVLLICVTSFKLVSVEISQSYFLLAYLFCMICEVGAYCWFGQNLIDSSNSIVQSVYMSNWYEANSSLKKSILILMEGCKRPTEFRIGGLVTLSLVTFTSIMRSSYSYYAVLRTMTEK